LKKRSRDEFALLYMGVKHPEGSLAAKLVDDTRKEAKALGLGPEEVHFNEWVPFESRHDVAAACRAAVIAHDDHVETRYAFRTRALDAFAAGLPLITAEGDFFAALVEHEGAGAVFPCGDSGALADHLCNLADDEQVYSDMRNRSLTLGRKFAWREVCSDLRESLLSGALKKLKPGVRQLEVRNHQLALRIDESAFGKLARKAAQKGKDLLG
jgi:glycosyltransferase involved in cell wall biosynthesis